MSWKTVAVSGVLDVEDLTEAKLFDLGEAIRTELAAYTKELTPERFDEALTALEARPTGRDIRNIKRRSRKSKKRVVREVAADLPPEDQRETIGALAENMTPKDQREVVVPIVGNMTPEDQREVVGTLAEKMTPEDIQKLIEQLQRQAAAKSPKRKNGRK